MPEPDVAIVTGALRDYLRKHPRTALLVVEVSDATLQRDRTTKVHLYDKARIADYWIVNLIDRQIEVHRRPGPDPDRKRRYKYHQVTFVPADGLVSPQTRPETRVAVADLLP
jgi:Uma2 family endonuclease